MATVVKKNNLGFLGVPFQYKLISAFIRDANFFKDLETIIDQNMFTDPYLRTVVGVMKEYCNKYNSVPQYDMLSIKLKEKVNTEDEWQFYDETLEKLKSETTAGHEEIEDMAEKFFKQQNWIRVSNEIKRIAGDGNIDKYDECMDMIDKAMAVGRHPNNMSELYDNIDEDLSGENVVTIPTGVESLDDVLGGGIDKGKVGVIIGSAGFGKTSMTTCFAANAAVSKCASNDYQGYKVLHVVFEDSIRDIRRKYYGKITQIETKDLNKNAEIAKELIENYSDKDLIKENVRIIRLSTGEASTKDISNIIKKKINEGFKPDLVIIDYFECLKYDGRSTDAEWVQEAKTMRKFENMAVDLDVAIWIPVQGNRDSVNAELVTMDKAGGAYKKMQIAQVIISITRSLEDIDNQVAKLAVLKNRSGKAGTVLEVTFNNGTCTISSSCNINFGGNLGFDEEPSDNDEKFRKMIRQLKSK